MHGEERAAAAVQSFAYEIRKDSAVIWRCFSRDTRAEIPAQMDGYPVTELAPYAFSAHMDTRDLKNKIAAGSIRIYAPEVFRDDTREDGIPDIPPLCGEQLEEIVLPETVRRVGRYCFYDCSNLRRIEFCGKLTDWGSGVFTRCHHVGRLRVYTDENGKSYLKDVLDELPETLAVEYYSQKETEGAPRSYDTAVLVFPEFYEEGVENTPARILETHVHGSGISYRNCFQGRSFDFAQYDTLFPQAKALENREVLAAMVTGRLRFPLGLTEKAKHRYEEYVFEHAQELAKWLLRQRDLDGVKWLAELMTRTGEREAFLEQMTEEASKLRYAEAVSYLMDCRRGSRRVKRRRLEL